MPVFVTHRGSVSAWECDENDHLNVRFYVAKANEGLPFVLAELGWAPDRLAARGARPRIRAQHMRFLKEARKATPLTVLAGIASADGACLSVYSEVRHSLTGAVLATLLTDVEVTGADGASLPLDPPAASLRCEVPAHGAPRGLDARRVSPPPRERLEALGFAEIARGRVRASECDDHGEMEPFQYIGRVSDGVVNLLARFHGPEELARRSEGMEGGALVELRVVFRTPLRVGSLLTVHSGLSAVGSRTIHPVHLVYAEETGECAAACEGVAVTMDLRTRRAIDIPEARRRRMQAGLVEVSR